MNSMIVLMSEDDDAVMVGLDGKEQCERSNSIGTV
eukprot:CAMPEP_0195541164 /NCGR_PEP_ID=MMETSP0794_2-20130614/50943_1 /TAXON_ID=515487 /ORGANISM="Stephanopyxis turris, Strain CCMP 815" /LENGTH=34 /DNA_ID= /DNA_START= /DNA_END= /DNA_ORIENTATION=